MDDSAKEEFMDDITDLYEDIREDHYESLTEKKYLSLENARAKGLKVDWEKHMPVKPSFFGSKVIRNQNLQVRIFLKYFRSYAINGKSHYRNQ